MPRYEKKISAKVHQIVSSDSGKALHLLQSTILLDEAKIREDARNVQYKSLEKGHTILKEENKTVSKLVVQMFYWLWIT